MNVDPPPFWPVVAITAHRKITGAAYGCDGYPGHAEDELIRVLGKLREEHGAAIVRSGMALGGDTRAALIGIGYGMDLEAHVPGEWQAGPDWGPDGKRPLPAGWKGKRWSRYDQDLWRCLLTYAADTGGVYVYDDQAAYNPRMFYARNAGLLLGHPSAPLQADVLVAVYDNRVHEFSGTLDTFAKATGQRVLAGLDGPMPVIHIDPTGDQKTHLCTGTHCGLCEHAA